MLGGVADWRILAVIAVVVVATAIFVVILRSNQRRTDENREAAVARGETERKSPNLTVLYFLVGGAFLVVGAIMLGTGH
jgi:large-conductance mechanosensitive channel